MHAYEAEIPSSRLQEQHIQHVLYGQRFTCPYESMNKENHLRHQTTLHNKHAHTHHKLRGAVILRRQLDEHAALVLLVGEQLRLLDATRGEHAVRLA